MDMNIAHSPTRNQLHQCLDPPSRIERNDNKRHHLGVAGSFKPQAATHRGGPPPARSEVVVATEACGPLAHARLLRRRTTADSIRIDSLQ